MATEQPTKVESELPAPEPGKVEAPVPENKADDSKALAVAEKPPVPAAKKSTKSSFDRDIALANVEKVKKLSFVKAWEEDEKAKVHNKAQKDISAIASWENTKKAFVEAKLKQIEEQMEKKKADYVEKIKNKVTLIHKQTEEKRAMVEARKGEEMLKLEEMAAKYRATGSVPKKLLFGCF